MSKIINDIKQYSKKSYLDAIYEILGLVQKDVLAIYRFGGQEVTYGLSDIDLQFVIRDYTKHSYMDSRGFSSDIQYILKHGIPHPMPHSLFKRARCLLLPHTLNNMELIYGEGNPSYTFSEEYTSIQRLFHLTKTLLNASTHDLRYIKTNSTFHARKICSILNSIQYTVGLLGSNSYISIDQNYIQNVNSLRINWFNRSFDENCRLIHILIPEYTSYVIKLFSATEIALKKIMNAHGNVTYENGVKFRQQFSKEVTFQNICDIENLVIKGIYPIEFYWFIHCFIEYGREKLSRNIRKDISSNAHFEFKDEQDILDIIEVHEDYFTWLRKYCSSYPQYFNYPIYWKNNIKFKMNSKFPLIFNAIKKPIKNFLN